jgi:hypothetical protein
MNRHDQRGRSARRPLLLNFVRPQPASDLEYRYDEGQRLNITAQDGVPIVAVAGGKARLKTHAVEGED